MQNHKERAMVDDAQPMHAEAVIELIAAPICPMGEPADMSDVLAHADTRMPPSPESHDGDSTYSVAAYGEKMMKDCKEQVGVPATMGTGKQMAKMTDAICTFLSQRKGYTQADIRSQVIAELAKRTIDPGSEESVNAAADVMKQALADIKKTMFNGNWAEELPAHPELTGMATHIAVRAYIRVMMDKVPGPLVRALIETANATATTHEQAILGHVLRFVGDERAIRQQLTKLAVQELAVKLDKEVPRVDALIEARRTSRVKTQKNMLHILSKLDFGECTAEVMDYDTPTFVACVARHLSEAIARPKLEHLLADIETEETIGLRSGILNVRNLAFSAACLISDDTGDRARLIPCIVDLVRAKKFDLDALLKLGVHHFLAVASAAEPATAVDASDAPVGAAPARPLKRKQPDEGHDGPEDGGKTVATKRPCVASGVWVEARHGKK